MYFITTKYNMYALQFISTISDDKHLGFCQCYALQTASVNILVHISYLTRTIILLEGSTRSEIAKSKDMLILNVDLYRTVLEVTIIDLHPLSSA